ncbi:ATP-binding protein [Pseudomonas putida]|uniref:ATP-binding protein n=1 Tax=Pseudomonas putida TaxID=303 RepID=UPI00064660BC|nr:ATP-binding protein [Pseudomonas putida]
MDIRDTRPVEIDLHPVCNQRYLIPTFSIGETYALVLKVIRRRDSGLVIWGHTRYGKTWAMLYCQQCLAQDFPDFPIVIYNAKREISATKGNFYNSLLAVVGHKQWNDNVSLSKKHLRLVNFMEQAARKDSRQVFILFIDEAQRLQQQHFDWVKDIYNDLRLKGVTLLPILVGQQQLLDQKEAFLKTGVEGEAIVNRFMLYEHPFRGIREKEDFATCLGFFDSTPYPANSTWTFTKFFVPQAYDNGFRLALVKDILWDTFCDAYKELKLKSKMEIPMQYFSKTIEIILRDSVDMDHPGYTITREFSLRSIRESWFQAATRNSKAADPNA